MDFRPGVVRAAILEVEPTRRRAQQAGYATFVLPDAGIVDRGSFFAAMKATLPMDPPLEGDRAWDAMADSLWQGLYDVSEDRIAILWPNARTMAEANPPDFQVAEQVLLQVASGLADPRATLGKVKNVAVIIECEG